MLPVAWRWPDFLVGIAVYGLFWTKVLKRFLIAAGSSDNGTHLSTGNAGA
jgi:hypothetical protein